MRRWGEWKETVNALNHMVTVFCVLNLIYGLNTNILKSGYIKYLCNGNREEVNSISQASYITTQESSLSPASQ